MGGGRLADVHRLPERVIGLFPHNHASNCSGLSKQLAATIVPPDLRLLPSGRVDQSAIVE